jgi:hypothetical protein
MESRMAAQYGRKLAQRSSAAAVADGLSSNARGTTCVRGFAGRTIASTIGSVRGCRQR